MAGQAKYQTSPGYPQGRNAKQGVGQICRVKKQSRDASLTFTGSTISAKRLGFMAVENEPVGPSPAGTPDHPSRAAGLLEHH
jgi:hypothetical protein